MQTNSSSAVTYQVSYDSFGIQKSSSGSTSSPFGFVGAAGYQQDSDSGLMLLGHRYYDSSTGRFLTRDPVKDGRNWYGYCGNNPNYWIDPTGFGFWGSIWTGVKWVAGVAGAVAVGVGVVIEAPVIIIVGGVVVAVVAAVSLIELGLGALSDVDKANKARAKAATNPDPVERAQELEDINNGPIVGDGLKKTYEMGVEGEKASVDIESN